MYTHSNSLVRRDELLFQGACSGGGALTVRLDNAAIMHLTAGTIKILELKALRVFWFESYSHHRLRTVLIYNGHKQAMKIRYIKLSDLTRPGPQDLMQHVKTVAFGQN